MKELSLRGGALRAHSLALFAVSALSLWLKTDWLSFLLHVVPASMHYGSLELQAKITSSVSVSQAQQSNYCVAGKGGLNV